jgi:hypothetical protein
MGTGQEKGKRGTELDPGQLGTWERLIFRRL